VHFNKAALAHIYRYVLDWNCYSRGTTCTIVVIVKQSVIWLHWWAVYVYVCLVVAWTPNVIAHSQWS